jgi:hypothetical protein
MSSLHRSAARQTLINWHGVTNRPDSAFWDSPVDWEDESFVSQVIERLNDEIQRRWALPADQLTSFGGLVIQDILPLERQPHSPSAFTGIGFIRLLMAGSAIRHAVQQGRSSIAYNWNLCAISERSYVDANPGEPIDVQFWLDRPDLYLQSRFDCVSDYAPLAVIQWLGDLYYIAWKFSMHHGLAGYLRVDARRILSTGIQSYDSDAIRHSIEAAAQLAAWLNQSGETSEAKAIADVMEWAFNNSAIQVSARKPAGMALATRIGFYSSLPPSTWARKVLDDCRDLMAPSEIVHMIAASCATPEESVERFCELLGSFEECARRTAEDCGGRQSEIEYRQAQLYESIAPTVRQMLTLGRCKNAMELIGAWFGVPTERRRSSPVLGLVPNHDEGLMFAVEGSSQLIRRDTDRALRRMVDAINHAFDQSVALRTDLDPPRASTGERGRRTGPVDEYAEATADFFGFEWLPEYLRSAPTVPVAFFEPYSELTPIQALAEARLGTCWPRVTSFQEPLADRPICKALIWSCGTYYGQFEATWVTELFTVRGIECVSLISEDLTPERFQELYSDVSFDVLYLTGHGHYDPREPGRACIDLSWDKEHKITVADMLDYPVAGDGRRLLFLNICLGGTVQMTSAPTRLGMGALLANANQAVIAHMAEVSNIVGPLYGALVAVGLVRTNAFFQAYRFAVAQLFGEHVAALQVLRDEAIAENELLERLGSRSPEVDLDDIRTWGTPVFYE